jgi:hypothetical protein
LRLNAAGAEGRERRAGWVAASLGRCQATIGRLGTGRLRSLAGGARRFAVGLIRAAAEQDPPRIESKTVSQDAQFAAKAIARPWRAPSREHYIATHSR